MNRGAPDPATDAATDAASQADLSALAAALRTPLDRVLSDPQRLRIQSALHGLPQGGSISFTELRTLLGMTDGALGRHLAVLVEVGYAGTEATFRGRRRTTWYSATTAGRHAFTTHVAALRSVIEAAGQP